MWVIDCACMQLLVGMVLVTMACVFKPSGVWIQVLHKHEEDLLVVLGNVPLEGFHLGSSLDACTLVPSPQAALLNSQRLLQVITVHFKTRQHCSTSGWTPSAGTFLQIFSLMQSCFSVRLHETQPQNPTNRSVPTSV